MRAIAIVLICCLSSLAYSQTTNIKIFGNSGFAAFKGSGSSATTQVNQYSGGISPSIESDHYFGQKSGTSYGVEVQAIRKLKNSIILGLGVGYESIATKSSVSRHLFSTITSTISDATGETTLNANYLDLNPFIGYSTSLFKTKISLTAGTDLAIPQKLKATTTYRIPTISKNEATFTNDVEKPTIDIRPRVEATVEYKKNQPFYWVFYGTNQLSIKQQ